MGFPADASQEEVTGPLVDSETRKDAQEIIRSQGANTLTDANSQTDPSHEAGPLPEPFTASASTAAATGRPGFGDIGRLALETIYACIRGLPQPELVDVYDKEAESITREVRERYGDLLVPMAEIWNMLENEAWSMAIERCMPDCDHEYIEIQAMFFCLEVAKHKLATDLAVTSRLISYVDRESDVFNMAKEFSGEQFLHAVITFYFDAVLHQLKNNGDASVRGINTCVYQVSIAVGKMTKDPNMRQLVLDHVIPLVQKMIDYLRKIDQPSHQVAKECEAWCLYHTGICYSYCGEYEEYANCNEEAIAIVREEFSEEANTMRVYAWSLNNAGVAYGRLNMVEEAIEMYMLSLEAKEQTVWLSEEETEKSLKITRNNLEINLKKRRQPLNEQINWSF